MDARGRRIVTDVQRALYGRNEKRPLDEVIDDLRDYVGGRNRMESGGETRGTTTTKKKAKATK